MLPTISAQDYITQRIDDQIAWYDNKSGFNQGRYKPLKSFEIIAAASIPVITAYVGGTDPWSEVLKFSIGFLGAAIAVSSGIAGLCRYQELWVEYRGMAEVLRQQKFLFLTRTAPYDGDNAFPLLVQTVENLLSKENANWMTGAKARNTKDEIPATAASSEAAGPQTSAR
jgi:Protein of unknown function (DUF4231)